LLDEFADFSFIILISNAEGRVSGDSDKATEEMQNSNVRTVITYGFETKGVFFIERLYCKGGFQIILLNYMQLVGNVSKKRLNTFGEDSFDA